MKKIVLVTILVGASVAQAQLRTSGATTVSGLRNARVEMEARTESTILEKLETARLEDERNRREQFESLNFSVVQDPMQAQVQQQQVVVETQTITN